MKKKTIIILLILTLSIYALNINVQITAEENIYRTTSLELTPHGSILIDSDSDFEVFPGTGTTEDPYIIEGYNITTTSQSGIYITYTTKYFIVRNCYIDADEYGINVDDVADGTATVINNTCRYNNYGIMLWSSNSSTVANNTCNNNNVYGIYLEDSSSSNVANNTCNNNDLSIMLWSSSSSTVTDNTCNNNNENGIFIYHSSSSTVANNTFTNYGLYIVEDNIDDYLSYIVENNWVNGRKIGFYTNLDSTIIAEPIYGQLILVNCTNVTVRDQILNNTAIALSFYYCVSSVIINNTCNYNYYAGISLYSSVSSTVTNNTCSNNNDRGIYLRYSSSSTITNNTCSNNGVGTYLEDSSSSTVANNMCNNNNHHGIKLSSSRSSTVINNTCNNNNENGIYLSSSVSSTVTNNTCSNNGVGTYLEDSSSSNVANNMCSDNSDMGIRLYSSRSSTVINNTCNNNNYGIFIYHSDLCVVTYNLLQENEGYGIYLIYYSDNILIHHNNFVDNNLGGTSQAYDDGFNNFWYDTATLKGNYWSDWSGIGSYSIDGPASSVDLYPLGVPVIAEYPQIVLLTLLFSIISLFLIRVISKKAKKK